MADSVMQSRTPSQASVWDSARSVSSTAYFDGATLYGASATPGGTYPGHRLSSTESAEQALNAARLEAQRRTELNHLPHNDNLAVEELSTQHSARIQDMLKELETMDEDEQEEYLRF